MTLADIKAKLEIPTFKLNPALNEAGEETEWVRHWDNNRRVAVSLHQDLYTELKKDQSTSDLDIQHEVRTTEKGDYDSYRIVKYKPAKFEL